MLPAADPSAAMLPSFPLRVTFGPMFSIARWMYNQPLTAFPPPSTEP